MAKDFDARVRVMLINREWIRGKNQAWLIDRLIAPRVKATVDESA